MKKDQHPYAFQEILTIKEVKLTKTYLKYPKHVTSKNSYLYYICLLFLQNNKDISYRLQAVGCHRGGTIKNGHYETYVRNNSTWILISDCQVHI